MAYLDKEGLSYFWNKIKSYVDSKLTGGKDYTAGSGVKIEDDTISVIHPNVPLTQVEYDALSQEEKMNGSIYIITDQELPSSGEEIYSTEETRIGTWIDGKPLYRRIVDAVLPNSATNNQWTTLVNLGVLGELVNFRASIITADKNTVINSPAFEGTNRYIDISFSNTIGLCFYQYNFIDKMKGRGVHAIVEYTKTTDSPEEVS